MGIVGRLDQYASMLAGEFDETTSSSPRISGLSTYFASEFSENVGIATTLAANVFPPYDLVYDDFGGTLFGAGQGRYMRQNTDKSVIVYNEIDEVSDFYTRGIVRAGLVLDLDAGIDSSYPGTGTTWTDLSPYSNNGTLTNGPTFSSSNGGSIVFDGTNDEVTTTNLFANPTIFTICSWFKTSTASGRKIIGFENSQTGTTSISYDRHLYIGTDGKIYFGLYDGATKIAVSTSTLNDGNWHYIVGTYGSEGTTMRLYVDGISNATATATIAQPISGWWRIASYKTTGWTNAGDGYFTGNIASVQIYNRALTASEVKQNYDALKHRFGL